ncbi:uncharacterized protein SAPINGB_P001965 [Magnusiomyces paraingens]|uniref:serine--tRNA ligase n=1 Tax=Magnusiomyces paraingens TaxID=2606893 RepID=A0A5E8BJD1_9ASCO|nr:uncharacterized protein SAPINGB_P001965 [Saprochaete ingens]VVT48815.1 unnamed protein product [Saprochaete ingens]
MLSRTTPLRAGSRSLKLLASLTSSYSSFPKELLEVDESLGAKIRSSSSLKKPQFDFKFITANAESYAESAKLRNFSPHYVEGIKEIYPLYTKAKNDLNNFQARRSSIEAAFMPPKKKKGKKKSQNEGPAPVADFEKLNSKQKQEAMQKYLEELKQLKVEAKQLYEKVQEYETTLMINGDMVPNLISPDSFIPEPEVVDMLNDNDGARPVMAKDTDHVTVGKELGLIELDAASRVSGSSWYYLTGNGALLEQALVNYALSKARRRGYSPVIPPSIVRQEMAHACGFRPRDTNGEQQIYNLEDSDLCLTGTAEIPLAGLYSNAVIEFPKEGPNAGVKKHVGVSRSYRAEAGARGRDTKGLYRVHEFTKVELFAWTDTKSRSVKVLEDILALQKEIIFELGITARVLNMSPDELGAPAYKKYDIEAWMPGRRDWGEVTSSSNCTDFQSRRMHTKYRNEEGKLVFVQTLNGTAMAVPRVIVAILETFYEPENKRVKIPEVLRKWMDDQEYISL